VSDDARRSATKFSSCTYRGVDKRNSFETVVFPPRYTHHTIHTSRFSTCTYRRVDKRNSLETVVFPPRYTQHTIILPQTICAECRSAWQLHATSIRLGHHRFRQAWPLTSVKSQPADGFNSHMPAMLLCTTWSPVRSTTKVGESMNSTVFTRSMCVSSILVACRAAKRSKVETPIEIKLIKRPATIFVNAAFFHSAGSLGCV
jgi:hypothetical protein